MQLVHLKNFDAAKELNVENNLTYENQEDLAGKKMSEKNLENINNQAKDQLKNTNQIKSSPIKNLNTENKNTKINITNFQDLISLSAKEKEIELKYDLERNVKLVKFDRGNIDISFNEKLNKNFIKNLTEKLHKWTGERWIISLSKNQEAKSIYEKNLESKKSYFENFKKSNIAKEIESAFPDAELFDITNEKE